MKNSLQSIMADFNQEFLGIELPEGAVKFDRPAPEVLNAGLENGTPLISVCPPKIEADTFFVTLNNVAGLIKKYMPGLAAETEQIINAMPSQPDARETFISRVFTPGTNLLSCLEQDLPPETLGFLLNHTVKLFMRQYALNAHSLYDSEHWLKSSCPVCGGRPTLALLEKDTGKRLLYCGMCEVKWRFQRLGCPFCLNGESEFFTVEGMEKYRVYFCEKCKGYIKTIDGGKTGGKDLNLFWEDINTIQLDILAIREGFFSPQAGLPLNT
ncbi:MAG: formate dehydrogenase accessory protein FdhE [Pelotomaculum sp.]|uniref:FdhE central domain-containing protein n=1 Tax=Pelotomaculum thermopropionicum (strain DSM 13744 / JCM 10971 / SI) TaxID=370438 RepID=A5D1K2_PELTS|nr:formate dehydrogenase accessory protein FdhE [Pelotomaculum sp.]BAF59874.1 hypothetical protein PTH_1693 [Pelotomaculum thermopropionicum SI]